MRVSEHQILKDEQPYREILWDSVLFIEQKDIFCRKRRPIDNGRTVVLLDR